MLQIPRGIGNNIVYAIGSCINGSLNVILNVIFIAILRWGVKGMLLANISSLIVTLIIIFVKLKLWKYIKINKYSKKYLYKLIKYSLPLIPSNLCWWVVNASDRLIIQIFIDVSANGIYSIASKFPSLFSLVT
ncbi:MAG: oligosaccharide flippase family protein, partial [Lachnospiraceae bacterium]|nr:oligosaccharide flippase family protein [Lachnospiraceae bacterium]